MFGESLFNDGVTVVLYNTFIALVDMTQVGTTQILMAFLSFFCVVLGKVMILPILCHLILVYCRWSYNRSGQWTVCQHCDQVHQTCEGGGASHHIHLSLLCISDGRGVPLVRYHQHHCLWYHCQEIWLPEPEQEELHYSQVCYQDHGISQ